MNLRLLLPVKPWAEGKQRLARRLTPIQRYTLNRRFCLNTFHVACQTLTPSQCIVVSHCDEVLGLARAHGMQALREHLQGGLNAALEQARAVAVQQGADAALSLSCDLPHVTCDDLGVLLARAAPGRIVLAQDRSGSGTNALLTCPPTAIAYAYGDDSHARHRRAALDAGFAFETIHRPGLAGDVDTTEDFEALQMKRTHRPSPLWEVAENG